MDSYLHKKRTDNLRIVKRSLQYIIYSISIYERKLEKWLKTTMSNSRTLDDFTLLFVFLINHNFPTTIPL